MEVIIKKGEKDMEERTTKMIMEGEKDKFPPRIPPSKISTSSSSSSHHHHHVRCLRPPPPPPPRLLPGILIIFCVLLSVVSLGDVARGQHLGRVPPAVIVISNPGERGLIPAQPFWPPQAHAAAATTTTASIPISTPSQHARAHLNEVETGVVVQDHGYRKAPPGASTPLPRLVLAALFRLAAEDQALTAQPASATHEPTPVTPTVDTTNPAPTPLSEEHTPFFLPSQPDPHLSTQLPTFPGTQFPRQPHTPARLQPESILQSLPPSQSHSGVEHVRPASLVKSGVTNPTQPLRVHQRQGHHANGAALTDRPRHHQGAQSPLRQLATAPPAPFPGVKPGHSRGSANAAHLLGVTQPPAKPLGRPLPTDRPVPRPRPLQPPTRPPLETKPAQPSIQPPQSKGVSTTSDQSKSEEDYYYYYYGDEDYYYYDDYGNSAGRDSSERGTSPARPVRNLPLSPLLLPHGPQPRAPSRFLRPSSGRPMDPAAAPDVLNLKGRTPLGCCLTHATPPPGTSFPSSPRRRHCQTVSPSPTPPSNTPR
ncbi:leucine-rich repeat extensin-like protein 5 [Portunus trituberculatus]|uniref:leucine-rich repeat extensin-like protein 5 n=1 Tax=Portunus trituberculatus TaxID=210409 RepID=UPI001E1CF5D4|nr:leucine-rich repeat extensin-like protein 5 [Portunus trituberculatus]